mmetsp:Transcript_18582/g.31089  ORF Transcript_18582/g.31089 Transcript_18582/m.31089 type:complete len:205 (-) Transcript_18582:16-630(-)|eukprot:CAMPEP_0119318964 /NCGR_PEP_ID=MMETSP1333-20130426/48139_1 /TAXON_ID=418940 /ORGANISM="Scyphosphaera apsteinii, Strain RCC1455" /LENGTH=204 /DNA_ID=CAMNT_0007325279 /DNA_START=77 /DNA_END=691 /DNA_ORIENTATION=+
MATPPSTEMLRHLREIFQFEGSVEALPAKSLRKKLERSMGLESGSLKSQKKEIARLAALVEKPEKSMPNVAAKTVAALAPSAEALGWPALPMGVCNLFCPSCGSILADPTHVNTRVDCRFCDEFVTSEVLQAVVIRSEGLTCSIKDVEPVVIQKRAARATVKETCPECKHDELEYYTMQLRSADEGQTVFFECRECGHKFSTNT